jgi:hypothetical protein
MFRKLSVCSTHNTSFDFHFTAAIPLLEQTRIIAANYKTIDKETKDFCSMVASLIKQRHSLLITSDMLQEFQEGPHQKKTKTKMNPVNEEAFSPKKPHLATVKTNRDTKQAIAIDVPQSVHYNQRKSPTATDHVNQSAMTSNLLASGKSSMDTLGTFYHCSTLTDRKNEMFSLPFSIEYIDVQSTANRKIQEKDKAADMTRTNIMALRCEEEEESSLMSKRAYPMPCCQLVGGGSEHAMDSLHSTHSTEEAEVQNSKVSYEFDELPVDDSVLLGELSSECSDIKEDTFSFSFPWEGSIDLHRP